MRLAMTLQCFPHHHKLLELSKLCKARIQIHLQRPFIIRCDRIGIQARIAFSIHQTELLEAITRGCQQCRGHALPAMIRRNVETHDRSDLIRIINFQIFVQLHGIQLNARCGMTPARQLIIDVSQVAVMLIRIDQIDDCRAILIARLFICLLYTSPSPRD